MVVEQMEIEVKLKKDANLVALEKIANRATMWRKIYAASACAHIVAIVVWTCVLKGWM